MKQRTLMGNRLFFIEFLTVLFFFLIISSICLRLFGQAHQTTHEADERYRAQNCAASAAELIESDPSSCEALLSFYPDASVTAQTAAAVDISVPLNRDFHSCPENEQRYALSVSVSVDNLDKNAVICVYRSDQTLLYTLSVSFHRPITREEALS